LNTHISKVGFIGGLTIEFSRAADPLNFLFHFRRLHRPRGEIGTLGRGAIEWSVCSNPGFSFVLFNNHIMVNCKGSHTSAIQGFHSYSSLCQSSHTIAHLGIGCGTNFSRLQNEVKLDLFSFWRSKLKSV
jgi:hypothetical protein